MRFKAHILDNSKIKRIFGEPIDGQQLADLATKYTAAKMPELRSAWESICQNRSLEESNLIQQHFDEYGKELEQEMPFEDVAILIEKLNVKLDESMANFVTNTAAMRFESIEKDLER